jgi:hypothetical protein
MSKKLLLLSIALLNLCPTVMAMDNLLHQLAQQGDNSSPQNIQTPQELGPQTSSPSSSGSMSFHNYLNDPEHYENNYEFLWDNFDVPFEDNLPPKLMEAILDTQRSQMLELALSAGLVPKSLSHEQHFSTLSTITQDNNDTPGN